MGSHHHAHDHHHQPSSVSTFIIAVVLTLSFAIVEAIGGFWAHSLALLSDAGHMALDSFALVIAAIGAKLAARGPSHTHTFGHGRAEVLTALISCSIMLVIAGAIITKALQRFNNETHHINSVVVMSIAVIGLAVNVIIAYVLTRGQDTLNSRAALLHVLGDLLGSVAALLSGIIIYATNWLPIDAILSLFIATLIATSSLRMLKEITHVLMEGAPKHLCVKDIEELLYKVTEVTRVHHLRVWQLSSQHIALSAHIETTSLSNWPSVLLTIQTQLRKEFAIKYVTIQPEIRSTDYLHCSTN